MHSRIPSLMSMMQGLIKIPSISSIDPAVDQSNLAVINVLAEWLESLNFDVEILSVGQNKANLIASLGNINQKTGLVLSGHTDTVPFDDGLWTFDPFKLTEKNDRLYGLGSTDMKTFFGIALEASQYFEIKRLKNPLVIVATADEESSMSGAKLLRNRGIRLGQYAVIGEPTSLQPIRMHKGVMMESIEITGISGHSSDPALGASALEGMHAVLTEVLAWRADLQRSNRNPYFDVEVPTLNLGAIHGGDSPNRICAHCETKIDIRPLPGMDILELRDSLKHRLNAVLIGNPKLKLSITPMFEGTPAFETSVDSAFVNQCEKLSNRTAGSVAFGTEAPYFSDLGIETVVMGPGSIDQAHQPNEYLSINQINPAIDLIKQLINRYCISDPQND